MKIVFFSFSLAILVLCSCAPTPKTLYKDFYETKSYSRMNVSVDATMLHDKSGKKEDAFVVTESNDMLKKVESQIRSRLAGKGYRSISRGVRSTGLSLGPEMKAFVAQVRSEDSGKPLKGPHRFEFPGSPPSATQKYATERLYERLLGLNLLSKQATEATFPEVKDMGLPSNQYLCVVSGLGRNVHAGKQIGQALLTAALTLGYFSAAEPDIGLLQIAVIDPRTQKIVWANQVLASSNPDAIAEAAEKLMVDFPNINSTGVDVDADS